ncbi:MAG: zf-HC2 domain-containing protein [Anaerolineales bacterium]|nr:zf-HC2 domain-containing protein [Anaerolineales bacterium]
MNKETNHISTDQIQAYLDQGLDQTEHQEVEIHLDQCPACRKELSRLEIIFARLENLPPLELEKDLSLAVLSQLRKESKLSLGITWTLVLEALGAGTVIGLLIPAIRAAAWLPVLADTKTEIQAAINIFLTQLASSWLVWWAGLQMNIEQTAKSLFSTIYFPNVEFSPWILILAAGGIGLLANYILLRSDPIRGQNHKH